MPRPVIAWKAIAIAPVLVPVLVAGAFIASTESRNPFAGFLFLALIGCIGSYAITVIMFVPALVIASRFTALTGRTISLLGALLGLVATVPYMYIEWHASGVDSGPPTSSFIDHLLRDFADPVVWMVFPGGGLITAMAYALLASRWAPSGKVAREAG
jgi:hypothetical protein